MNQETHWDKIASRYEGEIFDVFKSDKKKVLNKYFSKHAHPDHSAIDFGCGIGKAFPYLSSAFGKVLAIDISEECIQIARQRHHKNITFKQADLAKPNLKFPPADFAFCCNVAMLPEVEKNVVIFRNIGRALKKEGKAVIVLPSLESIFFSSWRLIEWYRSEGTQPARIPLSELAYFKSGIRNTIQGIIHIDGVPTKHYSEVELKVLFEQAGLEITAIEKLEYDWDSEFSSPPSWMKAPFPWDWMIECRPL